MSDQDTNPSAGGAGRSILCDLAGITGAGLISFGSWLVFPPAGFIVLGLFFVAGAAIGARSL